MRLVLRGAWPALTPTGRTQWWLLMATYVEQFYEGTGDTFQNIVCQSR